MTANVMASDRIACLEAGMNDHVGKPFELDHLVELLLRHTGHAAPASAAPIQESTTSIAVADAAAPAEERVAAALNVDDALSRMGGNTAVFATILQAFSRDAVMVPEQLAVQLASAHPDDAARTLHTLKGLAATVGAVQLARIAAELEALVKAGIAPSEQGLAVARLRTSVEATVQALDPLLQQFSPTPVLISGPEMSDDQLRAELMNLLGLLKSSNMQALDVFEKIRKTQELQRNQVLVPLGDAIRGLDFVAAAALCEAQLSQSPE
jgi:HPt (histidine-containing phosphotransfer) domain-containing protein